MLLTGDAGIGKTRLAEELVADATAAGHGVHWGRSWEDDGAPAFWPWVQILRDLARDAGSASPHLDRVLEDLTGAGPAGGDDASGLDGAAARFRLFDAVANLLLEVATACPRVLVLEDLHWADTTSIMLLEFVVRHTRNVPLLAVATYRDVDGAKDDPARAALARLPRHGETFLLGGLGAGDVERYVAATLGDARAQSLAPRLHRETDGHPFFLVEMVRLLERGTAPIVAVPDGVRELIARRLHQRSADCRRLLEVASVVGRDFSIALLRRLPALADVDVAALVDEAAEARIVVPTGAEPDTYRFGHALVRDACYASLARADRGRWHVEVAGAIEAAAGTHADEQAAVLAHHHRSAVEDGGLERAVHWGTRAGERAGRALAHEEALGHFARTLELLEHHAPLDEARRCPLLIALGLARVRTGDPAAAAAAFERAVAIARGHRMPDALARAALGLGEVERAPERVVPLLEEALALCDDGDGVLRARLLARLAVALYWDRTEHRKRALSDEAVAMARRLGYAPTLAFALGSRIAALSGPDDVEARLAAAHEMTTLADRGGGREFAMIGYGWTVADALALGDVHQARFAFDAFAALAEASRHPYFAWWLGAMRTMYAILDARFADAATLSAECFAHGRRAVSTDAAQVLAGQHFALAMEGDRHDEIEPVIRGIVTQFPGLPSGHAGLAFLHADRGRVAEATAILDTFARDRCASLPRNPEWLTTVAVLAQTSALLPDAPHAAMLFDLLAPYRARIVVAGMGVLVAGAVAHFLGILAVRLGRLGEAEAYLTEALAAHERIGAVVFRAYTRYEHARLALARNAPGDEELAARLVGDARRDAEARGMQRLQRLLAEVPVAAGPARPEAAPGTPAVAAFRRDGDSWCLGWNGAEFRLRDRVGLRYLAALLAEPGRDVLAVDLVRTVGGRGADEPDVPTGAAELGPARPLASAEATLDARAEQAYRARVRELRDVLDEARRQNDLGRIAAATAESDALTREIARGLGLASRGRDSRSPIERARVSATRAIRTAIALIHAHDRRLARHLTIAVKTGTYCSYAPERDAVVTWNAARHIVP